MSDYEEDFEDADDVVVEENELTSPSRFVPVQVQSTTRTGLSGGGADGKGATGVSTTQGRKMSSELKTKSVCVCVRACVRVRVCVILLG